ncbi:MAG TPA: hypothetical protein VF416_03330, partial [Marmoricola sp.]
MALIVALALTAEPSSARPSSVKKDLTLTLATPGQIVTGSTVTFTGTAPRTLNGRGVTLQRKVGKGGWVKVAAAKVSHRAFSLSGKAIKVGVNKWRVVAKRNGAIHTSKPRGTTVWKWFGLNHLNAVSYEYFYFEDGPLSIGA